MKAKNTSKLLQMSSKNETYLIENKVSFNVRKVNSYVLKFFLNFCR